MVLKRAWSTAMGALIVLPTPKSGGVAEGLMGMAKDHGHRQTHFPSKICKVMHAHISLGDVISLFQAHYSKYYHASVCLS
jgi:hypothetical protein